MRTFDRSTAQSSPSAPTERRAPSRRLRALATALVALLAVTGCGAADEAADEVGEAATELASEMESDPPPPTSPATTDDSTDGPTDPTSAPGADDGTGAPSDDGTGDGERSADADDSAKVGANGRAYLARSHPRLVVEVDVQEGLEPDGAALDHLLSTIGSVASKRTVGREGDNTFASDTRVWTADDLRAVAEANRDTYSKDGTVSMYVLYVKGRHENEDTIGLAYNASEFALFPERWQDITTGLVGGSGEVEKAVLVHEAGHLFGLVNLTYESKFSRESEEHPGHSRNEGSVMHYAIETTAIGRVFDGPPPSDFDDRDRADLRRIRTGSY